MYPSFPGFSNPAIEQFQQDIRDMEEGNMSARMPDMVDQARKEKLTSEGVEFEADSCFRIIIYSAIPPCFMENPCQMASGLQQKMVQGQWGIVEDPNSYPHWHRMKITYDLRDLDTHDTDITQIYFALGRLFWRCHKLCLRERKNDWEDKRSVSKRVDGEVIEVLKVEECPRGNESMT